MIVKAQAGSLATSLALAALPIAESEARRFPTQGAVRLAGDNGGLLITCSTFDATLTTRLDIEAEGEMAVSAGRFADLVEHFPADAEITITTDNSAAIVISGRSKFRLPVFPIADMPAQLALGEETGRVELEAGIVRELFAWPLFAASTEETRFYLNGICLRRAGDNLVAVATDGQRLCRVTTPAAATFSTLLVPRRMVKTIVRLLDAKGAVTLRQSERLFAIEGAGFTLVSKLIDATYPDYERLIPSENLSAVTVNRATLSDALARFAAIAEEQVRYVNLDWDADGLHLSGPDGSTDCLAADVEGEAGTAVQIRHLTELLDAMRGDNVRFATRDPHSPILVTDPTDGRFTAIQMPFQPQRAKS